MVDVELCQKIAHSFHRTTQMEYEELLQEAYCTWFNVVEKQTDYDPRRASLKTFATTCIHGRLSALAAKNKHRPKTTELDYEMPDMSLPADAALEWQDKVNSLTVDAKLVVRMILESPHELLTLSGSEARKKIVQTLVEQHGFAELKAKGVVREIRSILAA